MARAGKVRGQTPKVDAQEKKKKRTGIHFISIFLVNNEIRAYIQFDEEQCSHVFHVTLFRGIEKLKLCKC